MDIRNYFGAKDAASSKQNGGAKKKRQDLIELEDSPPKVTRDKASTARKPESSSKHDKVKGKDGKTKAKKEESDSKHAKQVDQSKRDKIMAALKAARELSDDDESVGSDDVPVSRKRSAKKKPTVIEDSPPRVKSSKKPIVLEDSPPRKKAKVAASNGSTSHAEQRPKKADKSSPKKKQKVFDDDDSDDGDRDVHGKQSVKSKKPEAKKEHSKAPPERSSPRKSSKSSPAKKQKVDVDDGNDYTVVGEQSKAKKPEVKKEASNKKIGLSNPEDDFFSSPPTKSTSPAKSTPPAPKPSTPSDTSDMMLVDKHKPTSYKQIIGQQGDRSNVHKLMNWLRNWHKNAKDPPKKRPVFGGADDGSSYKAVLLSGPPGIGKTTSATLVCKELGFEYKELNASDQRSKKSMAEEVATLLTNKVLTSFFDRNKKSDLDVKHCLIMDEVDGMAGNEDRGGIAELIQLIKKTKVPIICICNDRFSQKMRSLTNYCYDLRFYKPQLQQIKAAMLSVCCKEKIQIDPKVLEEIIVSTNSDIRQCLHYLSVISANKQKIQNKLSTATIKDVKLVIKCDCDQNVVK